MKKILLPVVLASASLATQNACSTLRFEPYTERQKQDLQKIQTPRSNVLPLKQYPAVPLVDHWEPSNVCDLQRDYSLLLKSVLDCE